MTNHGLSKRPEARWMFRMVTVCPPSHYLTKKSGKNMNTDDNNSSVMLNCAI